MKTRVKEDNILKSLFERKRNNPKNHLPRLSGLQLTGRKLTA